MRTLLLTTLFLLVTLLPAGAQSPCSPMVLGAIRIEEHTTGHDIDLDYPVLCNQTATRTVRDFVTRSLAEFKGLFPNHDLTDYRWKHAMTMRFAVWTAGQDRFASVKLHTTAFTGGAHPNNWPDTWIFDLATGESLTLDDIFMDTHEALDAVAPLVRETLQRDLGQMCVDSMLESGTTPTRENYGKYVLTEEGIAFFFAPYSVAPYAAGEQVVTVPFATIKQFLRPELAGLLL